jgi:glycosyltransferase involved in cell wall biosynthesis
MMKIALVDFPLLDVGGITTWNDSIKVGYEKLGHEVKRYYATPQNTYKCDPEKGVFIGDKTKRGMKLPAEHLSYNSKHIESTLTTLEKFDLIHFIHPSPHPTKSVLTHDDMLGWLDLYKLSGPKKITTMHDVNWAKTNEWFIYASQYLDMVIASQQPHWEAVQSYPTSADKMWSYFPMKIDDRDSSYKKVKNRKNGIVAHQWIKWKHHDKIIKALDQVSEPIDFFAGGQQYHELLKSGDLKNFICHDFVAHEDYKNDQPVKHTYHGFINHDELVKYYKEALFSIDGSTKGYNNYTHVEPMLYGCISMVHEDVLAGRLNCIPEDACVSYNWDNLVQQIIWIKDNPKKVAKIRKNAYQFIVDNYECGAVAKKILNRLKKGKLGELDTVQEEWHLMSVFPKVAEADGYNCWGQNEKDNDICQTCPFNRECELYVNKNGVRVIESEQVEDEAVEPEVHVDMGSPEGGCTGHVIAINNPTGLQIISLGVANIPPGQYTVNVNYKASDM